MSSFCARCSLQRTPPEAWALPSRNSMARTRKWALRCGRKFHTVFPYHQEVIVTAVQTTNSLLMCQISSRNYVWTCFSRLPGNLKIHITETASSNHYRVMRCRYSCQLPTVLRRLVVHLTALSWLYNHLILTIASARNLLAKLAMASLS